MVMFTGTPPSGERVLDLANGLNIDSIILSRSSNSNALKFAILNGGAECFVTTSSNTIVQNTWLTIVATYESSNFHIDLTVNGVSFTNTCTSARADRSFFYTYIGGGGTGSDFFFQGSIAWLYTVDSALEEKGIEQIITNLNANEDISAPRMPCLRGTYGVMNGQVSIDSCINCEAGKFSTVTGGNSSATCEACPVGTYGAGSAHQCVDCEAGTYNAFLEEQRVYRVRPKNTA